MAQFKGLFTALITPFNDNGVDEKAFQELVAWQADQGVQGVVPVGTTGESPTLSHDEHKRVVELAVEAAAGRITVMAGAGSNSTGEAISFVKHAKQAGADGVLIVAPYYNKPTQQGLYEHYNAIQAAADLPNFIYNIPGRSVVNITDETLADLAKLPNIAGVKDATGDLARVSTLRQLVDDDFILLSGEDMTTVGFNAMGGHGCISVTSNVAPAAQLPEDEPEGVDVRSLPRVEVVGVDRLVQDLRGEVSFRTHLGVVGDVDGVRLGKVADAQPQVGDGAGQIALDQNIFCLQIAMRDGGLA